MTASSTGRCGLAWRIFRKRPNDFVRGLIGGPHGRDHQVGPLVERRQVGRRIVAGLAQAPRVEKADDRHFLIGETEQARVPSLGPKSLSDHGVRSAGEIADDRRLSAARLSQQPQARNGRVGQEFGPPAQKFIPAGGAFDRTASTGSTSVQLIDGRFDFGFQPIIAFGGGLRAAFANSDDLPRQVRGL